MSSSEHTPTPWSPCHHLKSPEHDASCSCGYRGSIWSADGETIVLEMGASPDRDPDGKVMGQMMPQADRPTQLADAAFILNAVNAHDVLVAQNEWLKARLADLQLPSNSPKNIEEWLVECGMPSTLSAVSGLSRAETAYQTDRRV